MVVLLPGLSATMNEETKERLRRVGDIARTTVQYGLVPLVIYLGTVGSNKRRPGWGPRLTVWPG